MKKFILVAALLVSLQAQALDWKNFATLGDTTIESQRYAVSAIGHDLRLYEWDCPQNPKQVCWMTIGSEGSSGSGSYPKAGK